MRTWSFILAVALDQKQKLEITDLFEKLMVP